jgi:thioredoxin 1
MIKRYIISFVAAVVLLVPQFGIASQQIPVSGMVTMVDLGAKKCIPCKMMAPILEKLEKEYEGKAAIRFIDVWQNPDEGPKFGIRAIPTQIFYDKNGKERGRHEGFLDEESIRKQIDSLMKE